MCGIFSLLNVVQYQGLRISIEEIKKAFYIGQSRGPEKSILNTDYLSTFNSIFGFHRLAINGLNDISNQPIIVDNILLICNGEIYNYKYLYKELAIHSDNIVSNSDCEVIIHMY